MGSRRASLRDFVECHRGAAGIEFALVASTLCLLVLNIFDVANYIYTRMQVENAAQMGAQAAWKTCDPTTLPATKLCAGLGTAVTAAVQSTSLGNTVSLQSGALSEGYYCLNPSGDLQPVGTLDARPVDCSATSMPNLQPGNYIKVSVTYSYRPLFSGLTVARFLETPVQSTSYMRLL
ncbi:TadE/TadG family type IV pilus assembly protein [Microvirga sp.]|uniref:TadE/TadG family type IV pilus assembly protein n=1 Tax=Microvirga sp. TaxID=1873136 RepID=UPI001FEF8402|nr:TadE/TadG family type IV pilus assembly protein [Microvirga sp.]